MKWTTRIVGIVLGLALAGGAVSTLRTPALDVDTAPVVRGPLEQNVTDEGKARVREHYTVSAPVTGTLARIELHEGDVVEPGAVLARLLPLASPLLDPESRKGATQRLAGAMDASEQARASVSRAQAASDQANRELERVKALVAGGALPAAQVEQTALDARMRAAELASAQFAVKVSEHDIGQARAVLARFAPGVASSEQFLVTSPVHGQVLHLLRKSEGVVTAGAPLLELGDPRALELVVDVLSQDAVAIRTGMPARVIHWGGAQPLMAKVRRVEPAAFTKLSALGVEEQRVNIVLDLDSLPADGQPLGDGFAVEVEITVWSKGDALRVPTSALYRAGEGWALFVVVNGHARARQVRPGHRGALETEVLDGVSAGEAVIAHPGAAVRDGAKVVSRGQ